jgi:hypothetical protein
VYIACRLLVAGGDGHVHVVHTIAKRAECANVFAKWTRGLRYNNDFVLLNENVRWHCNLRRGE